MTQFWYGAAAGFATGVFGVVIVLAMFIRFYNRASEDERKYDDDRFFESIGATQAGDRYKHDNETT